MSVLLRYKFFLWYFGAFKVPLIGHLKPHLIAINDQEIIIKLSLKRRSKNHLNSMYFGALAVGADLAGGLHGFYHARALQQKVSLAFKSFQAQFIRRPESDVYFVCRMGEQVKSMILESEGSGFRVNKNLQVTAYTNFELNPEVVAEFILELSVKVIAP